MWKLPVGKLRNTSQHPLNSRQPSVSVLHSIVSCIPPQSLWLLLFQSITYVTHLIWVPTFQHMEKKLNMPFTTLFFSSNFPTVSLAPEECFTHGQEVDKPSVGPQWLWARLHTQYKCPQLPITSSNPTIFQSNILCVRDSHSDTWFGCTS